MTDGVSSEAIKQVRHAALMVASIFSKKPRSGEKQPIAQRSLVARAYVTLHPLTELVKDPRSYLIRDITRRRFDDQIIRSHVVKTKMLTRAHVKPFALSALKHWLCMASARSGGA